MNIQRITDFDHLVAKNCRHLFLTNLGATDDHSVMLPPVNKLPLGPIVVLGAAPHDITFHGVANGDILCHGGRCTSVIVPGESCIGSFTWIVNLFGEAWHVSSSVPLDFK